MTQPPPEFHRDSSVRVLAFNLPASGLVSGGAVAFQPMPAFDAAGGITRLAEQCPVEIVSGRIGGV